MLNCKISAPGKIILHGEHSVVYGKRALVSAIGLRTDLLLKETEVQRISLEFSSIPLSIEIPTEVVNKFLANHSKNECLTEKVKDFIKDQFKRSSDIENNTLAAVFYVLCSVFDNKTIANGFQMTVKTDLRIGAGSGSSAAFGVCIATAFLLLSKKIDPKSPKKELISELAFESEKIIHLNPSGVDNTICTYGGLISFVKGKGFEKITVPKSKQFEILLLDTGVSRNTAKLVELVAEAHKKFPRVYDSIFEGMHFVVQEAIEKYSKDGDVEKDFKDLEQLFEINNGFLKTIGVSHPSLEAIFEIVGKHGFHSKLTGAGGGGYAIALVPPGRNCDKLVKELGQNGFESIKTVIGGDGVSIENL